jgi:hypothetical protein
MFWSVSVDLTEAGLADWEHVAASIYRAVSIVQRAPDEQLQRSYAEAAELAAVRFDWRDRWAVRGSCQLS